MPPVIAAAAITGGVMLYSSERQKSAAEKAQKKAEAARAQERKWLEEQAGEYQEIGERQMAIQALQSQTRTLVEVLDSQKPAPRIFTLPAVESTDPVQRINRAIDDFVRGRYG